MSSSRALNLICICLDTFRFDIVGEGKNLSFVKTPNLDALVSESVVFDQAFGEGQPTLQMRRAFFTGRRSFPWRYTFDRRGVAPVIGGWHKIPPEQDTLAEILLRHGYMTGLISSTYHMFKPTMNFTRGFVNYEFIRGQEADMWRGGSPKMVEAEIKKYVRQPVDWLRNWVLVQYLLNVRDRKVEEDYFCAHVFLRGERWLEENMENQPFFLWLDSFDPHEPWDPPRRYADHYCPNYRGIDFIHPTASGVGSASDTTPEEQERIKALYFGEVSFVDKWVGHFLMKVDELGLRDDSIIMFLSDHGVQLLEHGRFGKDSRALHPYNTQINWAIRHPEGPKGKHVKAFVQSHDVMPTALSLLGINYSLVDGENVWPLVIGERERIRDHVVIGWASGPPAPWGRASVRDEEWNYVTAIDRDDPNAELYHLPSDPEEHDNVISDYPDVVAKQRARLEAVLGQPLPATLAEVCGWEHARYPFYLFMKNRYGSSAQR